MKPELLECFLNNSKTAIKKEITDLNIPQLKSLTITFSCKVTAQERYSKENDLELIRLIKDIENDKPTLYYFQITQHGGFSSKDIAKRYKTVKEECKGIGFSAIKEKETKSEYLYVGKVRRDFRTRLRTHLDLGQNKNTQGLRLRKWLPENVYLTLYYGHFDLPKYPFLVDAFEEFLKKELKPIVGVK